MIKRFLTSIFLVLLPLHIWAGATFTRATTWAEGDTLTAAALNAEFDNILNNDTPAGMDDYSATTTEMRAVVDPYPGSAESLPTNLQGELERLRYQILEVKKAIQPNNVSYWYQDTPTAGVFSVLGSSVGVNDTTPAANLDVTGTMNVTGQATLGNTSMWGSFTSTTSAIVISTNVTIAGSLSVSGGGIFSPTHISCYLSSTVTTDGSLTMAKITTFTEIYDTKSEMNTSTFTATETGYYSITLRNLFDPVATPTSAVVTVKLYKNGTLFQNIVNSYLPLQGSNAIEVNGKAVVFLTAGDALTFYTSSGTNDSSDVTYGTPASEESPCLFIDRLL